MTSLVAAPAFASSRRDSSRQYVQTTRMYVDDSKGKTGRSNIYQHRFTESVLRPHVPPAVTLNNNVPRRVNSDYFPGQYLKNGHPVAMKIYTAKCEGRHSRLSFVL